jgi:hypothetical protein
LRKIGKKMIKKKTKKRRGKIRKYGPKQNPVRRGK